MGTSVLLETNTPGTSQIINTPKSCRSYQGTLVANGAATAVVKFQYSNDMLYWFDLPGTTFTLTTVANGTEEVMASEAINIADISWGYARAVCVSITGGMLVATISLN